MGHDGLSEPFERQPSLHFLHIRESPKMQRLRTQSGDERPRTQCAAAARSVSGFSNYM